MGTHRLRIVLASVLLVSMSAGAASAQARPEGQLTIAFDVSIAVNRSPLRSGASARAYGVFPS
jgi:hypothetical protein